MFTIITATVCFICGIVGLSGGLIIKPLFTVLEYGSYEVVSITNTFIVFTMAIFAMLKHKRMKTVFDKKIMLFIVFGSFIGSLIGKNLAIIVLEKLGNEELMNRLDSLLLLIMVVTTWISVFFESNLKTYKLENKFFMFLIGCILGTIASYLSVGGGSINILFLMIFFGFTSQEASIYSVALIIAATGMSIISSIHAGFLTGSGDYLNLFYLIPVAAISGWFGSHFNKKTTPRQHNFLLQGILLFIILLNLIIFFS